MDRRIIPIIYGDKEFSNVDIKVEEKNGKYYTSFKTEQDIFPGVGVAEAAEFKPLGNEIMMIVDSMKRQFDGDNSGVNLNIKNNTKKVFVVEIINDDTSKPRIKTNDSKNVKYKFTKE